MSHSTIEIIIEEEHIKLELDYNPIEVIVSQVGVQGATGLQGEQGYSKRFININIKADNDGVIPINAEVEIIELPFSGDVVAWYIKELEGIAGSIAVDVLVNNISITNINTPALNTEANNKNTTITDWTSLNLSDVLTFRVTENTNCKNIHLVLEVEI